MLLDTCAFIWFVTGQKMSADALDIIHEADLRGELLVSPVSAWEVGLLSKSRGDRQLFYSFHPDPQTWFRESMAKAGIGIAPFTPEMAIASSYLPGQLHNDPSDRMLIATARELGIPLVTRDAKIITYAAEGWLDVIAC